jgi:hypothetical protein
MVFPPIIEWGRDILDDATQLVHMSLKKNTIISFSRQRRTGNFALLSCFSKRAYGQTIQFGSFFTAYPAARGIEGWFVTTGCRRCLGAHF